MPVDAANPDLEPDDFYTKALLIDDLNSWAQELKAKHALFLFDSCFSGSIFQSRAITSLPTDRQRYLRDIADQPVRQVIAAGRADEKLPAVSHFAPLLIDLLAGRRAAPPDGYLTGRDIGVWMMQNLPSHNPKQHPHSGYVAGRWDMGDMVFQLAASPLKIDARSTYSAVVPNKNSAGNSIVVSRFRDCDGIFCPWVVAIPTGKFKMGQPRERSGPLAPHDYYPLHWVRIGYGLVAMEAEVTVGQFKAFVDDTGYKTGYGFSSPEDGKLALAAIRRDWRNPGFEVNSDHPVVCVDWNDASAYADWLRRKAQQLWRLPTESEWEYVARAGGEGSYSFGEDFYRLCLYGNVLDQALVAHLKDSLIAECNDGHAFTAAVRSFRPNAFGLYDVHGNVREWVQDCWHDDYFGAPTNGSSWETGCGDDRRVVRGEGWADYKWQVDTSYRRAASRSSRRNDTGFRLVRAVLP